jgi:hypothetical protein
MSSKEFGQKHIPKLLQEKEMKIKEEKFNEPDSKRVKQRKQGDC